MDWSLLLIFCCAGDLKTRRRRSRSEIGTFGLSWFTE